MLHRRREHVLLHMLHISATDKGQKQYYEADTVPLQALDKELKTNSGAIR